jgi:hypothetical protein
MLAQDDELPNGSVKGMDVLSEGKTAVNKINAPVPSEIVKNETVTSKTATGEFVTSVTGSSETVVGEAVMSECTAIESVNSETAMDIESTMGLEKGSKVCVCVFVHSFDVTACAACLQCTVLQCNSSGFE